MHSVKMVPTVSLGDDQQESLMFEYIEKPTTGNNHLKKIRIELGLTITALSKMANVSTKVISQTERGLSNPTPVTKSKIVKGLNLALPEGEKKIDYTDVFPDESL